MEERKFLVYKSSAGSGKTFTLVKEYLTMALASPGAFRKILAITFTNKAAGEMKDRVVRYLKDIRDNQPSDMKEGSRQMFRKLKESSGMEDDLLKERAGQVLNNIIHNYSDFAISTIDSFVHRLVRSFAFDLNLPVEFEVVLDGDELLGAVIEKLLSRVGSDPDMTEILVGFIESRAEEEGSWKIERDLMKASRSLFWENTEEHLQKLRELSSSDFRKIVKKINLETAAFENKMKALGNRALELIGENDLTISSFKYGTAGGIGKYFDKISRMDFTGDDPGVRARNAMVEDDWYSKTAEPSVKSAIDNVKARLADIYREIQACREKHEKRYRLLKLAGKNIYQIATLSEIEKIIDEFRQEDHIIHISEFNKRIARVVLEEPVPFIFERTGERFNHFLIDEFQDTSILQWQNLIPLIENSLSSGNLSMVVGDTKQAIYRFRSGEVEQFARLPALLDEVSGPVGDRQRVLEAHYRKENLAVNYRSSKDIVGFNNDFFSVVKDELDEGSRVYFEDVAQAWHQENTGYVKISFLEKEDYADNTIGSVFEEIRTLKGEGFRLRDIAVLCRSNDNASRIARHLLRNEIAVVSSESLLLSTSPEVNFLVSWLKYLQNPGPGIPMANILSYLVLNGKIPEADIRELMEISGRKRQGDQTDLTGLLESHGYGIAAGISGRSGIYDLVEQLVRVFGLHEATDPYVLFFLDTVLEQASAGLEDPGDFLDWLEVNYQKLSVVVPENIDAVRVMTIHKAKGLEFPVVIYPFADSAFKFTKEEIWVDPGVDLLPPLRALLLPIKKPLLETEYGHLHELERKKTVIDLLNILYVAFTRASERLYVMTKFPPDKQGPLASISSILRHYLKRKGIWNENLSLYEFGTRAERVTEERGFSAENRLEEFVSQNWKGKIVLSYNSPVVWDAQDPGARIAWGNTVHEVLSRITQHGETESVLEEMNASGTIGEREKAEIGRQISAIFENREVLDLFDGSWEAFTERELIDASGTSWRPDRILRKDGMVKIIDFKTGKRSGEHEKQLRHYASVLRGAGYDVAGLFLLYVSGTPELVKLN